MLKKIKLTHSLESHLKTHDKTDNFKCNKCDDAFDTKEKLEKHVQEHMQSIYMCEICHKQAESKEELDVHKKSHDENRYDKEYKELEDKYNILKENYERLVQVLKKAESNNKDKEYALEIQNEELKLGYEKIKSENIKLQDNLDTQNKLWKIWIQKFDDKPTQDSIENPKETEKNRLNDNEMFY